MTDKKYSCHELYNNLSVWSFNGKINYNPCSFYNGFFKQTDTLDIADAWDSPTRKNIIKLVNEDQPVPGCHRCYTEESAGLVSRRMNSSNLYTQYCYNSDVDINDGPRGLDYSVGNLCNLKCIICGPHNSSQWLSDHEQLNPSDNLLRFKYQKNNQPEIKNNHLMKNLVNVHFHGGGEPLLSSAHINLLQKIKEVKGLADVRVFYNTNGTVVVTDEVLRLWEECKLVELYFSIDDIGERFNYQRTGADFENVNKNLQWYMVNMPHNHMFNVNVVWSYLNFYYLDQVVDWHSKHFSSNRYGDPTSLKFQSAHGITKISYISPKIKSILLEKFQRYPTLLALLNTLEVNLTPHSKFLEWIQKLDNIRNVDFNKISPDWAKLLHDIM